MLDQARRGATCAPYSLMAPLPSDVVLRPSGRLTDYRSYPVFSLPWLKGRSLIFLPIVTAIALMESTLQASVLNDLRLGVMWALIDELVWICMVCAGPALATWVRHRGWPSRWERPAVFAAVALGSGLAYTANWIGAAYLGPIVAAHYRQIMGTAFTQLTHNTAVLVPFIRAWQAILFLCVGGGVALRTYVFEQKRWQAVQHERELEALRREKSEADLRVAVLQAQVEPHFLFNTLASVHSLIRQDPQRAEATIEALVDHLRATMPKLRAGVGQSYSTLAEQLEVCESYLQVMQVRMGARLAWLRDVPERLLSHPFPPLMLISLVENAVKHGIEPSPAGGNISLCATLEDRGASSQLAVSVIDDGVGLTPGLGGGVGLTNIRAQLFARFGAYGELAIRARPAGGVTATIRVPCVEARS
jgi:hypothetical protein